MLSEPSPHSSTQTSRVLLRVSTLIDEYTETKINEQDEMKNNLAYNTDYTTHFSRDFLVTHTQVSYFLCHVGHWCYTAQSWLWGQRDADMYYISRSARYEYLQNAVVCVGMILCLYGIHLLNIFRFFLQQFNNTPVHYAGGVDHAAHLRLMVRMLLIAESTVVANGCLLTHRSVWYIIPRFPQLFTLKLCP